VDIVRNFFRRALKLARLLRYRRFRRGLRFGVAASLENLPVLRGLPVGSVIDAGANVGQFTLLMRELHPDAVIHAFEPLDASAHIFSRLFDGNPDIHLYRCALGAVETMAALHVSRRPDNSSLLPIGRGQTEFAPGTGEVATVDVPVRRLDAALAGQPLPRPTLLKIDVQGSELAVLEGAERLLPIIDYVYVEVSFTPLYEGQPLADRVMAHLHDRGFRLVGIGGVSHDRQDRVVQADLLLSRRELADGLDRQ
jgi:FkbM family methyltransferase